MTRPPVRIVPDGGVTLACREYGAGEPLVLINGLASAMDTWNPPVIEALARHYRVVVFDTRGHRLLGLHRRAVLDTALYAGHGPAHGGSRDCPGARARFSMGACIAQELALAFPEKICRLVLVGGDCGGSEAVRSSPGIFARLIDKSGTPAEIARRMFPLLFSPEWLIGHDPLMYCPEVEETTEDAVAARQLEAFLSWPGAFSRLSDIRAKTLVCCGDADAVVPCENSRILAGRIPGAELAVFPGAGHGLMYQCPDRFSQTVIGFLSG